MSGACPDANWPDGRAAEPEKLGFFGGLLSGASDLFSGGGDNRHSNRQGLGETLAKSAARSIGSAVGREIIRGVLGSLLGGKGKNPQPIQIG